MAFALLFLYKKHSIEIFKLLKTIETEVVANCTSTLMAKEYCGSEIAMAFGKSGIYRD